MKTKMSYQHEAFTILREGLGRLSLPLDLVDEVIERHMAVVYEKGALALCEGNTDDMLACILSGYVFVYCPVGDGNRTLVRIAGPGEIIGYADYVDEKGRHARMFEAQVASKCTLALFSRDLIARRLADLPPETRFTPPRAEYLPGREPPALHCTLLSLPLKDRLTIVMSESAMRTGVRDKEGIILIPEIGHEDLAEMIGCRGQCYRMISEMMESSLLSRRGKQYVLLKKWDFNSNGYNSQKSDRRAEAVSKRRSSTFAVPAGSANRGAIAALHPARAGDELSGEIRTSPDEGVLANEAAGDELDQARRNGKIRISGKPARSFRKPAMAITSSLIRLDEGRFGICEECNEYFAAAPAILAVCPSLSLIARRRLRRLRAAHARIVASGLQRISSSLISRMPSASIE